MGRFLKTDRKLGVAEENSRYDLPLNSDSGAGFLITLIALMTFLTCAALTGFLMLGKTTSVWESDLQNTLTVEIPAENSDGVLLEKAAMNDLAAQAQKALEGFESVSSVKILSDEDVLKLVEPWLGNDIVAQDFPLPALLQVEMNENGEEIQTILRNRLRAVSKTIHLDAHEEWLDGVMRVTGGMQLIASLLVIIIGATTIVAIAGGIRTRMALHKDDVELLHLMGANDLYITKQFARHALILGLKGSLIGTGIALIALVLGWLIFISGSAAAPSLFTLSGSDVFILVFLPILICGIAAFTARYSVLKSLKQMP